MRRSFAEALIAGTGYERLCKRAVTAAGSLTGTSRELGSRLAVPPDPELAEDRDAVFFVDGDGHGFTGVGFQRPHHVCCVDRSNSPADSWTPGATSARPWWSTRSPVWRTLST